MHNLVKNTLILTGFTIVGQLLGFIINVISASLFGAGDEMSAYLVAQTIPTYVTTILIGGMGYTMIPMFIEKKSISEKSAWELASTVISIYLILLLLCTIIGMLFSVKILYLFFSELPLKTLLLSEKLSYILWPGCIINGLITIFAFVYQAYERFVYHAFTTFISSIVYLFLVYFGSPKIGIYILSVGSLLSSILQLLLLFFFVKKKYSFKIVITREVISFMKLQLPIIVAAIFGQFPKIIDRSIASEISSSSVSYLSYADKIKGLIGVVIGSGLSITFFPLLIQNLIDKNENIFKSNISLGFKITWILIAPIICFGSYFSLPFVSLVFERGVFSRTDSIYVATITPFFLISLLGATLGNVSSRAIYAMKKTNTIALTDIVSTLFYFVYAPILGNQFGIIGIGIATAILWNFGFLTHCVYLWYALGKPQFYGFIKSQFLIFLTALFSSYLCFILYNNYFEQNYFTFILVVFLELVLYCFLLYFMKINEFIRLLVFLKERVNFISFK